MSITKTWKEAEKLCADYFTDLGCYVHRLKDTALAGQMTPGVNPGDYLIGKHGHTLILEVKSTKTNDITRSSLNGDQVAEQFYAANKGVLGAYMFVRQRNGKTDWILVPWFDVIRWYQDMAKSKPGAFKSFVTTAHHEWALDMWAVKKSYDRYNRWRELAPLLRTERKRPRKGLTYRSKQ